MQNAKTIGAIDAGTNAIRAVVARTRGPGRYVRIHKERWPIRLGSSVFSTGSVDRTSLERVAETFRHFSELFTRYEVDACRAVATSAWREADNREELLGRVRRDSNVDLELVDGDEEARLTGEAIQHWLDARHSPDLVVDIGGGSLELMELREGEVRETTSAPLGTVRLEKTFGIDGAIATSETETLRRATENILEDSLDADRYVAANGAVGAGGNVETLAEIYTADDLYGFDALDLAAMGDDLERVTELSNRERMATFGVRRDRADVMAIAAAVLSTVGDLFEISRLSAPDVGVREGILLRLTRRVFAGDTAPDFEQRRRRLLAGCRSYANRFREGGDHPEHVRALAVRIFDELSSRHEMGREERLALECAALLHEIGYAVRRSGRHKHAAYLVENGRHHGLTGRMRDLVSVVVRHHRSAHPAPRHDRFMSLEQSDRPRARKLAGILRVADGLDASNDRLVEDLRVDVDGDRALFELDQREASSLPGLGATQKGHLFEVAFDLEPQFEPSPDGPDFVPTGPR